VAVTPYPLAAGHVGGQRLPGGIAPEKWDAFHDLILIDEIARCGYLGVIWALGCGNSIGGPPVITFGNEEQKQRFLPDMLSGRARFCLGVTEPDGRTSQYYRHSLVSLTGLHSRIRRGWYHHHG
jgi:alkylation response protein AidB-like acyl-CoA dehydrogenase